MSRLTTHPVPDPTPAPLPTTANERFKRGFSGSFWIGLILATVLHAMLFVATPSFAVETWDRPTAGIDLLHIPDVVIPPAPEELVRPAAPVLSPVAVDLDVTIPPTTGQFSPQLPPPARSPDNLGDGPRATPMTLRPNLQNTDEVARTLERHYPALLRQAGIGGTVTVWFFIDEHGQVRRTQINQSSGYDALDQAALQVAHRMRFSPAYNMDKPVAVWVSIPITFAAR
jgi:TonB family protein